MHYTSQSAVYDIVTNGEIWLSCIKNLNDPMETIFGLKVIREILKRNGNKYQDEIINIIEKFDIPEHDQDYFQYSSPTFLFSLTESEDSLPQWINYGNNGKGLAFRIVRKKLFDTINAHVESDIFSYIYPVCYYDESYCPTNVRIDNFEELVNTFLSNFYSRLISAQKEDPISVKLLFDYIMIFASLIKTNFHADEKEWRYLLVAPGPGDKNISVVKCGDNLKMIYRIRFRDNTNERLPPQRALGSMIEGLVIGPKNHGNSSLKWSLHQLIFQNWVRDGIIDFSKGKLN